MRRWIIWIILPLAISLTIVFSPRDSKDLLHDTDTAVLLQTLIKTDNPAIWWVSDWPLKNHFYRPVSTAVFQLDFALYEFDPAGYGLTNGILSALCVLLLFWFIRELTDSPGIACLASSLFGLLHFGHAAVDWIKGPLWIAAGLIWLTLLRKNHADPKQIVITSFLLIYLAASIHLQSDFAWRILSWVPGRTASTMLVFALISLACYARYERLTSKTRLKPKPSPFDIPATKGTAVQQRSGREWLLIPISAIALALALGSYEQAVMLPAILLGVAIMNFLNNRKPTWYLHAIFWGVLLAYILLRMRFVPSDVSQYQEQQFRIGPSVWLDLLEIVFPAYEWASSLVLSLGIGIAVFITAIPWVYLLRIAGMITAYSRIAHDRLRWLCFALIGFTLVSFLPMAFLKHFDHYWYWPSAMWCGYIACLVLVIGRNLLTALSPQSVQAPPRSDPAPGSLAHR